jgi:hypothetical protein
MVRLAIRCSMQMPRWTARLHSGLTCCNIMSGREPQNLRRTTLKGIGRDAPCTRVGSQMVTVRFEGNAQGKGLRLPMLREHINDIMTRWNPRERRGTRYDPSDFL